MLHLWSPQLCLGGTGWNGRTCFLFSVLLRYPSLSHFEINLDTDPHTVWNMPINSNVAFDFLESSSTSNSLFSIECFCLKVRLLIFPSWLDSNLFLWHSCFEFVFSFMSALDISCWKTITATAWRELPLRLKDSISSVQTSGAYELSVTPVSSSFGEMNESVTETSPLS